MRLSKSRYCTGIQCPKILWLDRNMPEQRAAQDDTRMKIGSEVGDLAMGYFGDFVEVPFSGKNMGEMIAITRKLIESDTKVITEASFSYDGNLCLVDILRKTDDGYEIIEVKSTSGSYGDTVKKVKPEHLDDMAYQYHIVSNSGIKVSKVLLMQLNRNYIRQGQLDLQQLFFLTDCTKNVLAMQGSISNNIEEIKMIAMQVDEPSLSIGSRCDKPYSCAYKDWCFRGLPKDNVFNIGFRMRSNIKEEAFKSGIITFRDVLDSGIKLSPHQQLQVNSAEKNLPPHVDYENIRLFLDTLAYPLFFLDFETYQQAIPLWDGVSPYQQITFQYSLHIQHSQGTEPIHKDFLGHEGSDPRRALAERLCSDVPLNSCVLTYFSSFEKGRIRELARLFPDLSGHLLNIEASIADLATPFAKGHYYDRKMGGSYSIKVVLPSVCGDDPDLDYGNLSLVQNGSEAMAAFAKLHEKTAAEVAEIRNALVAYCRLDTLAMVKILDKLYEVANA